MTGEFTNLARIYQLIIDNASSHKGTLAREGNYDRSKLTFQWLSMIDYIIPEKILVNTGTDNPSRHDTLT